MVCILPFFSRLEQALARAPAQVRAKYDAKAVHRWEPFDLPCSWRGTACWLVKFEAHGHPLAYGCSAILAVLARCCSAPRGHSHAVSSPRLVLVLLVRVAVLTRGADPLF